MQDYNSVTTELVLNCWSWFILPNSNYNNAGSAKSGCDKLGKIL